MRHHWGTCHCTDCGENVQDRPWLLARLGLEVSPDQLSLFDAEDAEIGSTTFQAYACEIGQAEWRESHGLPLTEDQLAAALARAEYQRARGLELLSDSARERLGPVLERVSGALTDMTAGRINPIQAGAKMAAEFATLEAEGGGVTAGPDYSPYEFSRLARTEAAFADSAAREQQLNAVYEPDWSAVDAVGARAPIHPQCLCLNDVEERPDGTFAATLEPNASACDLCLDVAAQVEAAIP